jgi:predicted transcriptional regulator
VDSEVGRTFRVTDRGEHAGKVVTVLTQRSRYQSAEDNEDMGDGMGGGWWLTLGCRPATPEETAKLEAEEGAERTTEAARRQKIADEKAAKEAEIATAKAKLADLTAGLVVTESFDAGVLVPEQAPMTVVKWSDGPRHYVDVVERKAVTGETVYIAYSHDFDDDRLTLYAPRPVVEASWAKVTERYRETPEKAREWLAKYSSNCVGADWRRWLVEQAVADRTDCS